MDQEMQTEHVPVSAIERLILNASNLSCCFPSHPSNILQYSIHLNRFGSMRELSKGRTSSVSSTIRKKSPTKLLEDSQQLGISVRGFGSQSTRFHSSVTEIPGPGYYHDESRLTLEKVSPSLSKKGYSNGFASTENHRDDFLGPTLGFSASCPGLYKLPGAMDYTKKTRNKKGGSLPFLPGNGERIPFPSRKTVGPEAGDYTVQDNSQPSPYMKNRPSAIFCALGDRSSFLDESIGFRSDSPGPGVYINSDSDALRSQETIQSTLWSRSALQRFDLQDDGTPGPTAYFEGPPPKGDEHSPDQIIGHESVSGISGSRSFSPTSSYRSIGTSRGQYRGKQLESALKIQAFDHDPHRFRNSFHGNLEEKALFPPGPGAYNLRPNTAPVVCPSKLFMTLDGASYLSAQPTLGNSRSTAIKDLPSASFRSSSPLRPSGLKPRIYQAPGPAYYSVKQPEWKATNQNLNKKWM